MTGGAAQRPVPLLPSMCGGGRRSLLVQDPVDVARSRTSSVLQGAVSSFILPMLLLTPAQAKDSESSGVLLWLVLRGTARATCLALRQVQWALSRLKRCWLTCGSRVHVATVRMCRTECQEPSLHCVVTLESPLHSVSDDDVPVCL